MRDLILAVDQGTQSVRVMIFDLRGHLVAKSQIYIQPYYSRQPGWAEQDCEYFWARLCEACRNLWLERPELKARVAAMSLTAQRSVTVCLDAEHRPLRPAISWLDQRRINGYPPLPFWLEGGFRVIGMNATINLFRSKAACNWLAANEPDLWRQTRHFLFLSGYLAFRLTGRVCDAVAAQVGYVPFDSRRQRWAGASDFRWNLFGVNRELLPDLVPAGRSMGQISVVAAEQTGIPAGLVLYASGADKACELLGSGAWATDIANLSYGTTATINTHNERYVEPIRFVPPFPAAVPNRYTSEIMVQRGYWMVNWFKEQFASVEVLEAQRLGVAPEGIFDRMLQQTPAGNLGLILQPFWNPGVRKPGPEAKGAIIGFGDVHTRMHMYRAIIEGIAYALRDAADQLERRNQVKIRGLKVSGGGSQSDHVMQITADIFGLPAERPHTHETSGLGAAINAAVGAGFYPDHAAAQAQMTHPGRRFEPNPEHGRLYDRLYREVYQKMYGRLAPLYRDIRRVTRYPRLD